MLGSFLSTTGKVAEEWQRIHHENKNFKAKVFRKIGQGRSEGTILLINGFSAWGHQDPRMINLGKQFAKIGFTVVAPVIEDLDALRITSTVILDITLIIEGISNQKDICHDGKIAVFAPSYTAGMSLIACSKSSVREKVKALCCVGTYANIESSLEYVLRKQKIDNYGRLILLKNFLPHVIQDEFVMQAIDTAILDNGLKRKIAELPKVLQTMPEQSRALFEQLDNNPKFRLEIMQKAMKNYSASTELMFELNVMDHAAMLNTSVCLIHGRTDNVIPPSESKQLFQLLKSKGIESHLEITPLIDHGDAMFSKSIFSDAYKLINAFSFFIEKARA